MAAKAAIVPVLYCGFFFLLTWPSLQNINTHVFGGPRDGLQMFWNIWWIRHAVVDAGTNPFVTGLLYYPESPNLMIHSLHSFGGFLGIPFGYFLNDVLTFNLIVAFAFALSGWGAYLLAREYVNHWLPAFVGGYVFTFSSYHFAHAQGHLNLVLMQWIPFYFLYLYRLLTVGKPRNAILAAVFLFLVLLCDHYYFVFCALSSIVFVLWAVMRRESELFTARFLKESALFGSLVALSSGVFVGFFLNVAMAGERLTGHNPAKYGMDFFALLIPGGHWRFHELTSFYWTKISGNIHGSSVHVGLAAVVLAVWGYLLLREKRNNVRFLWIGLFVTFFLLSLGTTLQLFGVHLQIPMPYDVLALAPPIRAGGVPNRFVVIAILSVSILAACGVQALMRSPRGRRALFALLAIGFVELLPSPLPETDASFPPYVERFAEHAKDEPGALLDLANTRSVAMLYQTRHLQPIQTGYLARIEPNVKRCARQVDALLRKRRLGELRSRWGFRYVFSKLPIPESRLMFDDGEVMVYEIPLEDGGIDRSRERRLPCPYG